MQSFLIIVQPMLQELGVRIMSDTEFEAAKPNLLQTAWGCYRPLSATRETQAEYARQVELGLRRAQSEAVHFGWYSAPVPNAPHFVTMDLRASWYDRSGPGH